jgi:hypothetical protein
MSEVVKKVAGELASTCTQEELDRVKEELRRQVIGDLMRLR